MTSCRYWPVVLFLPFSLFDAGPERAVLLKTHWVVVSRSVMKGSLVTSRSNQKWTSGDRGVF